MGHIAVIDSEDLRDQVEPIDSQLLSRMGLDIEETAAETLAGNLPHHISERDQINQLTSAFLRFDQTTQKLEQAYSRLQKRAAQIDRELAETNERLNRKVEELASLTGYLNDILESMHSGLIAINEQGRITTFNRAAEKLLGVSAEDAINAAYEGVMRRAASDLHTDSAKSEHNEGPAAAPLAIRALRRKKSYTDIECRIAAADDQIITVESTAAPLRNANDEVIGAVEIFRDLTEIRQLQERLHRADKLAALGEMSAKLAHEIRNPLNGIEGFASLLAREFDDSDRRSKFALNIVQGARNLNQTLTSMLTYAQPIELRLEKISLSEICDSVLLFANEEMRHKGIKNIVVDRRYDYNIEKVTADPYQLKQALLNLVLNAVQAMAAGGGALLVFTEQTSSTRVRIGVSDSGPGIDLNARKKIFDPFFTTKGNGTGLGLAIVHKIVELHGGKVTVESAPQKGTTFLVDLPIFQFDNGLIRGG